MSTELAVPRSLVEQAYDLRVDVPETDGLQEKLDSLKAGYRQLLPVEEVAKTALQARIDETEMLLHQSQYPEPVLPFEPLSWRWPNGLPKLALLQFDSPYCTIGAKRNETLEVEKFTNPGLPTPLADMYQDVMDLAGSHCFRRRSSWSAAFTFEGVLPAHIRETISIQSHSGRFHKLYMLVETPERSWAIHKKKGLSRAAIMRENLANLDPLILGYQHKSLFVLDKFDLTTLEQYVLDEFSSNMLPAGPQLDSHPF